MSALQQANTASSRASGISLRRSLLLIAVALGGCCILFANAAAFLFHLLAGWFLHLIHNLPALLSQWPDLILPLLMLAIILIGGHPLILWWLKHRNPQTSWLLQHSMLAISLILLACGAAIAMSGMTHQFAWLASGPSLKDQRGQWMHQQGDALRLHRMLTDFKSAHGRFPENLSELNDQAGKLDPSALFSTPPGSVVPEPLLLVPAHMRGNTPDDRTILAIVPAGAAMRNSPVILADMRISSISMDLLELAIPSQIGEHE